MKPDFSDANLVINAEHGCPQARAILLQHGPFAMTRSAVNECRGSRWLPDDVIVVEDPDVPGWLVDLARGSQGEKAPSSVDLGLLIAAKRAGARFLITADKAMQRFQGSSLVGQRGPRLAVVSYDAYLGATA